jgi:hypothetical protein
MRVVVAAGVRGVGVSTASPAPRSVLTPLADFLAVVGGLDDLLLPQPPSGRSPNPPRSILASRFQTYLEGFCTSRNSLVSPGDDLFLLLSAK